MKINKEKLAKKAQMKREELIKKMYEDHKQQIIESAEKGYKGYTVDFPSLDDLTRTALKIERENLSEIIGDMEVELITSKLVLTDMKIITKVAFRWDN